MASFIMNDQEVMDLLEEKLDEDSAAYFGECLSDCGVVTNRIPNSATRSRYIERVNEVLQELGVNFRAMELLECNPDDGYTWSFYEYEDA